jgi:hypothetical protein
MPTLARTSSNCKRQTHSPVRVDVTKDYHRKCSVEKLLVVSLEELVGKANCLAVSRQS